MFVPKVLRLEIAIISAALVVITALFPQAIGASCPAGSRAVTDADRATATRIGFALPSDCVDDRVIGSLLTAGADDIAFLSDPRRLCAGYSAGLPAGFNLNDTSPANWTPIRNPGAGNSGRVYFAAGQQAMNPGALTCFRRLFERAEAQGMQPCISAALRALAHQRSSCLDTGNSTVCGRSGRGTGGASSCPRDLSSYANCPHVNGLAIDVNEKGGKLQQLLSLARSMNFSKVGAGSADPWHIEARNCADGNFTPFTRPQNDTWDGRGAPAPSSSLTDSFRRALGMDTQPPAQPQPAPQAQPAPQPQPQIPQQQGTTQPGQYFNPTTGSTPVGTAPTPTLPTKTGSSSPVAQDPSQASYYSSVSDQLLQLAYDTPLATSTEVATSVPLTIDGSDVGGVRHEAASSSIVSSTTLLRDGYTLTPTNTFVSSDLAGGPYQVVASYRGESSGFISLLIQLRDAFAALLNILRPMGIREAIAPSPNHEEHFMDLEHDPERDFREGVEQGSHIEQQSEIQIVVE